MSLFNLCNVKLSILGTLDVRTVLGFIYILIHDICSYFLETYFVKVCKNLLDVLWNKFCFSIDNVWGTHIPFLYICECNFVHYEIKLLFFLRKKNIHPINLLFIRLRFAQCTNGDIKEALPLQVCAHIWTPISIVERR